VVEKKTWMTIAYFGLIVALIFFMVFIASFLKGEARECLKNPYVYGASEMGGVSCTCFQIQEGKQMATFGFNDTDFSSRNFRDEREVKNYEQINFSDILKVVE